MTNKKFSLFKLGITQIVNGEEITITDLLKKFEDPMLKILVDKIRRVKHSDKTQEKKERNLLKKYLPYCTVAGTFSKRENNSLITQSGYAAIDIDGFTNNPENIKTILKNDPYILCIFVSPSGNGLKVIINIPLGVDDYSNRVLAYYQHLNEKYHINIDSLDKSTHDISRACYISYDPNYYYNPKSEIFEGIYKKQDKPAVTKSDNSRSGVEFRQVLKLLYLGKSKTQIFQYAKDNFSKWNEQGNSYQEYTYKKAFEYYESNQPNTNFRLELINDLAEEIQSLFYLYTLRSDKNVVMYIYDNGIYRGEGRTFLYTHIKNCLKRYYTKNFADKIIDKIIPDTYIDPAEFYNEESPEIICVDNGILNLFTGEFTDFSPERRFFAKLPVKYDKSAKINHTLKQFETILYKEDIPVMQELYGYLLYRGYPVQKAFIFSGNGANGKTSTATQIRAFLGGENNCINISLESLENDKYLRSHLHTKLVNIADDIGKASLKETRNFKELTGSGMISTDKKFLVEPISFVNYAKMIFNANEIPRIESDDSDGFWRRWCVLRFDSKFLSPYEYEIRKNNGTLTSNMFKKDNGEMEKNLLLPEELSGVLNWAIEGFKRLMKQQDFSYNRTIEETKNIMERYSSNIVAFIQDCLEDTKNPEYYEKIDDLYKKYTGYCISRKIETRPLISTKFRKFIKQNYPTEEKRVGTVREHRLIYYKFLDIPEDLQK